jgi:Zn-dependent protease
VDYLESLCPTQLIGSILMLALAWVGLCARLILALRPNPRTGHMFVAAAGPLANLLLAVLVAFLWHAIAGPLRLLEASTLLVYTGNILYNFAWINVALFLFNLIPLPPLDGFAILGGVLPYPSIARTHPAFRFLIFLAVF